MFPSLLYTKYELEITKSLYKLLFLKNGLITSIIIYIISFGQFRGGRMNWGLIHKNKTDNMVTVKAPGY